MNHIYYNDILTTNSELIHHKDRGFLLADGIFETIQIKPNCKMIFINEHLERLKASAIKLYFNFKLNKLALVKKINELLIKNNLDKQHAVVRITLTRGIAERGLLPPENAKHNLLLTADQYNPVNIEAFSMKLSEIKRNSGSPAANIKTLNYMDNILAKIDAKKSGFDDAILTNNKNNIACATAANVFLVQDEKILTPAITEGVLPGIIRNKVLMLAKLNNMEIIESAISLNAVKEATEMFITNSLIEIQQVNRFENICFKQENITRFLQQQLTTLCN